MDKVILEASILGSQGIRPQRWGINGITRGTDYNLQHVRVFRDGFNVKDWAEGIHKRKLDAKALDLKILPGELQKTVNVAFRHFDSPPFYGHCTAKERKKGGAGTCRGTSS